MTQYLFTKSGTNTLPMLYHPHSSETVPHGFFGMPTTEVFPETSNKHHTGVFFAPNDIAEYYRESGISVYGTRFPDTAMHLKQNHGNTVISVTNKQQSLFPNGIITSNYADGIVTDRTDISLAIKTADCLPGLLYTKDGSAIGAFHAGWRGACKGIIENTVAALLTISEHNPDQVVAILGPCIQKASFEVQEDFIAEATQLGAVPARYLSHFCGDNGRGMRYVFDLAALTRDRLINVGVQETNIFDCGIDTCPPGSGFFSYRRMSKENTPYLFHNYTWISRMVL